MMFDYFKSFQTCLGIHGQSFVAQRSFPVLVRYYIRTILSPASGIDVAVKLI
jgi:hypothetical protein